MKSWIEKGCVICRSQWEQGKSPLELGINKERHTTLYRCSVCGAYWEEHERFTDIISKEDVMKYYPNTEG